jgi:hypothetical protein
MSVSPWHRPYSRAALRRGPAASTPEHCSLSRIAIAARRWRGRRTECRTSSGPAVGCTRGGTPPFNGEQHLVGCPGGRVRPGCRWWQARTAMATLAAATASPRRLPSGLLRRCLSVSRSIRRAGPAGRRSVCGHRLRAPRSLRAPRGSPARADLAALRSTRRGRSFAVITRGSGGVRRGRPRLPAACSPLRRRDRRARGGSDRPFRAGEATVPTAPPSLVV